MSLLSINSQMVLNERETKRREEKDIWKEYPDSFIFGEDLRLDSKYRHFMTIKEAKEFAEKNLLVMGFTVNKKGGRGKGDDVYSVWFKKTTVNNSTNYWDKSRIDEESDPRSWPMKNLPRFVTWHEHYEKVM